ncbi:hypothetical protein [Leptodesmis sp.]|uniref:hypothetical protein n=1 Tax=Leptodesmis sp. TaxID=3100501 RepID=UPI0040534F71
MKGMVTHQLLNPTLPGSFSFESVVYAAPGLNYSASSDLDQYLLFEKPTSGYQTRTIDLSDFADLPATPKWPFQASRIPINGILRVPKGCGPFPLVLDTHEEGRLWPMPAISIR